MRGLAVLLAAVAPLAYAQPKVGQPGKDVMWVATQPAMVERMLDMAKLGKHDTLVDLGSGDGVVVIAAARRGARALGVEYDAELVQLARRRAQDAGVGKLVGFTREDLLQTDLSAATVITMYLTADLNARLRPRLLALRPGTRVVSYMFDMGDWPADDEVGVVDLKTLVSPLVDQVNRVFPGLLPERTDHCYFYCRSYLYIVPARIAGPWRAAEGELVLSQKYQAFEGTLGASPVSEGRLKGEEFAFTAGGARYSGRVAGERLEGEVRRGGAVSPWRAERAPLTTGATSPTR